MGHRKEMFRWQRQLLDGRSWDQLSPAQQWELMDRMHDRATQEWRSGGFGWMHRRGGSSLGGNPCDRDRKDDGMMHDWMMAD
jgi:hypothetical protein